MSEGWFTTRREDVTIPREIMPIYGIGRDEKEKRECLFVRQDSTVVCRYPLDKVIVYKHPEYFKGGNGHETSWGLGVLINKYQRSIEPEFLQIHKVAIHPYNVRYIPPHRTNSVQLSKLIAMAKSRDLVIPMIVVPVDRNLIAILRSIAEKAEKLGLDPEKVLSGIIWRKVRYESLSKDHRLVAREDDEVYSALVSKASKFGRVDPEIEYLIVDGFLRYYASYRAFVEEPDAWNRIPEVYARVLQEDVDVLSAAYISRRVNSYEREIDLDSVAMSAFANLFDLGEVVMRLGERAGIRGLEEVGSVWGSSRPQAVGAVKPDVEDFKFKVASLEAGEEEAVAEEGKPEEEEREERREEPARRADVSEVQRQFAPTPSYSSAQPQPSAQIPILLPAQPVREEAQRSGQPQPVQLDEISVLSAALNQYFARHNPQAHYYVFQGKGIDVRLDHNLKKALENSGLSGRSLEIDIRYTNIPDLPVKGMQLKARVYVPVAWDKYCPSCGHLIVLSPTRCVFCGEVISPLPYVVSYRPAGT